MKARMTAVASLALIGLGLNGASGQAPRTPSGNSAPTSARVESAPLELIQPDRFRVAGGFEPIRRVTIVATDDGTAQAVSVKPGDLVRERQELVVLDRAEALANLKIAEAEAKERQAALAGQPRGAPPEAIAHARLEAAQARVDLAQLALERRVLKAPFAGQVLDVLISGGQFVTKGTVLAELADVSSLKALVPVERDRARPGAALALESEGRTVTGKVQALVPLPESFAALRELAGSWSAAWVVVDNAEAAGLVAGQRVVSPFAPTAPIAVVPSRAIRRGPSGTASANLQLVRNEHVATVPVRVLGDTGPERTQVMGAFRAGDTVIVESSVALADGTFLRFPGAAPDAPLETTPPAPDAVGTVAQIQPPSGAGPLPATRVAPIGAPESAIPRASAPTPRRPTAPAQPKPAPRGVVPF